MMSGFKSTFVRKGNEKRHEIICNRTLTAAAVPAMAGKTEPYTQSGTNAREMLQEQAIH